MVHWLLPSEVWPSLEKVEILLIDIRPAEQFCKGHPQRALCVPFSQQGLAERVETAAGIRRPVVFLTPQTPWVESAIVQLHNAGWESLGAVADDRSQWTAAGAVWATIAEIPLAELDMASQASDTVILDVREPLEWETGFVPGALLIPLGNLRDELEHLQGDREVTIICEAGLRSATAASILQACEFSRVSHVPDGTAGYRKSGRPLEFPKTVQEPST